MERRILIYENKYIQLLAYSIFLVFLLALFTSKIDAHAGTTDANGYTVATDLSGKVYTLLTDDQTTLFIFRSTAKLSQWDSYTCSKDGTTYTGIIQNVDLENSSYRVTLGNGVQKIIFLDDVQCVGNAIGFSSSTLTEIEGIKEHLDTSKMTNMERMFYNCPKLKSLDVSGFNTNNVTTMASMFALCESLTSLDVSKFKTGKVTDISSMFYNCKNLTSLDVSGFDTSNVTNMASVFYDCQKVPVLDVSNFNTENVTDMKCMFVSCMGLTSLNVSGFKTGNVTNMSSMFYNCQNIKSLDVSEFDTGNVTDMAYMFHACVNLPEINVTKFNTENVTNMEGMFDNCYALKTVDVSKFKTGKVTSMAYMFNGDYNLSQLDVSNFDTGNVKNMALMFQGCSGISFLDVSKFNTENVTNMRHMFGNCTKLETADVSGFKTGKVTTTEYMFNNCNKLTEINVSGFITENDTNMEAMFNGCKSVSVIDVSGFKTGKVTSMAQMFNECPGVSVIDVSGFDTGNVKNMALMFQGCSDVSLLDTSKFNTENVTDMRHMFSNCTKLETADVSGFKTGKVTDMNNMFNNCSNLAEINVSGFETQNVTNMASMFNQCKKAKELDVSGFITDNVTSMAYMFNTCSGVSELDLTNFVTQNVTSMHLMFNDCSGISLLDLSNFDTSKVTNMGNMFSGCSALRTLKLTNFDTSNVTSKSYMFNSSVNLSSLELGEKTNLIGSGLDGVSIYKEEETTGKWTLSDAYNHSGQLTSSELMAKTGETGGAAGLWVAEKSGKDPKAQGYTSLSTNMYDFAEHLDEDGNVKEGEDPVSLYRDDEGGGYWQKLSDGRWAYTFFVYKNDEVTWHIWEDPVAGYTGNYTITNTLDVTGSDIQAGVQPTITNTSTKAPKSYGTLTLTKKVIDENGVAYTTDKTFSFTVTLSGDNISGAQIFGDTAFLNGVAKVQLQGDESITLSDIPAGTSYSIQEDAADGYTSSFDNASGTITSNTEKTVICTNTKKTEQKDYVSFTVKKAVTSNADESNTVFNFHISFTGLEINTTYSLSDGTTFASDTDGNGNVDFSLKKDQTVTVQNIPVGARYIVTEDGGDYTSSYKITDNNGIGKIVSATGNSVQTNTALSTVTETADKGEDVLVTFTNKIVRTQNLFITKLSYLADGNLDTGDTSQYLIDIVLSGLTAGQKIKTSSGMLIADDNGVVESSMYISPNEKLTLFDVPVGTKYTFSEQANNKIASYAITSAKTVVSASGKNTVSDKALSTAEETVDAGEEATVTFTNTTPKSAKLQVIKYDNSSNKQKLGGAEFALYKSDGTAVNFTKDGTNIITIGDNGSSDVLDSPLFTEGAYYLEETKAPDGYLTSEPKSFTISSTDTGKTLQVEVYDDKLVVLPVTGGEGRDKYISLTCILMAMSISLVIYKKRRTAS